MTGIVVEGGLYFLLIFTPFAFGGVELWAEGVLQVVSGIVVAAWALERIRGGAPGRPDPGAGPSAALRLLWCSMGLFVLLVAIQLAPLPPAWIRALSPDTHALYAATIPGYAEDAPFEPARMVAWVAGRELEEDAPRTPEPATPEQEQLLRPPIDDPALARTESSWRTLSIIPHETRNRLAILICYVGLFAVVSDWYRSRERMGRLLGVLAFSGFAVSMFGMIQKLSWNGKLFWIREGTYNNPFGPFVNRNSYAAFAGAVLPLAICASLSFLRRRDQGRPGALPRLLLWGFPAVAMTGGIFYSLSRGGILCAALSMAIVAGLLLFYGRSGRDLGLLLGIALAAGLFLWWIGPEKVIERVGTLSEGQSVPSMSLRIGTWERALGLIASNPAVGTGLGSFAFSFMRSSPPGEGWWTTAHNEYIELVCDTGLAGGLLFLLGLASWLALVARPGLFVDSTERYAYMGLVSGLAALLVHSVISSNLQVPANGLLLVVLGAAVTGLVSARQPRRSGRGRRREAGAPAEEET